MTRYDNVCTLTPFDIKQQRFDIFSRYKFQYLFNDIYAFPIRSRYFRVVSVCIV